jgi:hypothetical protein
VVVAYPDYSRSRLKRIISHFGFAIFSPMRATMLCGPVDAMWVYRPPRFTQ